MAPPAFLLLFGAAGLLAPRRPRSPPRARSTKGNNGLDVDGVVDSGEFAGVALDVSSAFFRSESRLSRDVAVLAAEYALRGVGRRCAVVDAFAGSGARSLRYARDVNGGAVDVTCNEPNDETRLRNNVAALRSTSATFRVESGDATALLASSAGRFDVVDADSFGLSFDVGAAVAAARDGGLVLGTTTGAAAAGARGAAARDALLRRLGCAAAKTPSQNELGLRMLAGAMARAALDRGAALTPVVSLYSSHGPVFRVAAVVGGDGQRHETAARVGRVFFCGACGDATTLPADFTAPPVCAACGAASRGDDVAGPLWTGPLHSSAAIAAMRADAAARRWTGDDGHAKALTKLLDVLADESRDADLDARPFVSLDDVSRRANVPTPSKKKLAAALEAAGYRTAATHVDGKALKTDAPMAACLDAARVAVGRRPGPPAS